MQKKGNDMHLTVAQDSRFCNLVEFFWPGEGHTLEHVQHTVIAAYSMLDSAAIFLNTGAVLKSIDSTTIGCYELWRKETDFAELEATTLAPVAASITAVSPKYNVYLAEVVVGGSRSGAPQLLTVGQFFYVAEFHLNHKHHQSQQDEYAHHERLFASIKAFLEMHLLQTDGVECEALKSYTVSRATDNPSKVLIIAEYASVAAAQRLATALTNHPESPLRLHCPSTSSNVFEIVHIHRSSEYQHHDQVLAPEEQETKADAPEEKEAKVDAPSLTGAI